MIGKSEVEHIAKLARLGLTEKEIEKMRKDLSSILDYFNLLKEADASKVEATSHTVKVENVMREDRAGKISLELADRLVQMAPEKKGRHIKVKTVFE